MSTIASTPLSAIVVACCAAIALSGCALSVDLDGDVTHRTETENVAVAGVRLLDVSTANGQISVVAGDADMIEVTAHLQESREGDAEYRIDQQGDTLVVAGECDGGWFDRCNVGFDIAVPADLDVTIEFDNGRIVVEDLAGHVDVETDNGAITGRELDAGDVRARTDNGRIELLFRETPNDVAALTDNGAIAIRFPDDGEAHDVDASSDSGAVDVDVRTDPTSDRRIVVESDNGAVDVEYRS